MLTTLTLTMESGVRVTFPTGLKQLFLEHGPLANTDTVVVGNIGSWSRRWRAT